VPLQKILGERLRTLEPGGESAGSEAAQSAGLKGIGYSRDQRRFRSNDRQFHRLASCQLYQPHGVGGRDVDVSNLGLRLGAGVAGCDQYFIDTR
jgi:hypothetical protein